MNVALERREASGPNRDGAVNSANGELTPEDIWKEPADQLRDNSQRPVQASTPQKPSHGWQPTN